MIFICHHCHEPYKARPSRASRTTYCSMECKAAAQCHPSSGTFICDYCKQQYHRQPSQAGKTKYCSNKCRAASTRRKEIHCKGCRVLFTPTRDKQVYCTRSCRKKNSGKFRMHRVTKRCMNSRCGKLIQATWSRRHRKNYCSIACRSAARRIKNRPTPDQLKHLVIYLTYAKIAKHYDVCECTIVNWAKEYGIHSPCRKKTFRGPKHNDGSGYIGEAYGV